jgi:phosphoribosylaminoimidazolecarboxamide formyltransferase/IMP cyclohydrolase
VTEWLAGEQEDRVSEPGSVLVELRLKKVQTLKYGENPHQQGALYVGDDSSIWSSARWLWGPEPSYLNIFDIDAAWRVAHEASTDPTVVIVKHANPCGVATRSSLTEAYDLAFACDPISAFGGIVAFNHPVSAALALAICEKPKADVLVAPHFAEDALEILRARRSSWRIVQLPVPGGAKPSVRSVGDAYLVQSADDLDVVSDLPSLTERSLTDRERSDLQLAWLVCARTSSNAITIVRDQLAVGIGCGQQNRVDSARLAVGKAGDRAVGAVAASDAFFPFPDGLEVLAESGVTAVVAPSGSIRDAEIVQRARELGLSYVFAGRRHFRH